VPPGGREGIVVVEFEIPARGLSGNLIFAGSSVWALYSLSLHPYDFMSWGARASIGAQLSNAFAAMGSESSESREFFVSSVVLPMNLDLWAQQVIAHNSDYNSGDNSDFLDLVADQYAVLKYNGARARRSYLCVKLGNRRSFGAAFAGVRGAREAWHRFAGLFGPIEEVTAEEERVWRGKEDALHAIVSTGALGAERVKGAFETVAYMNAVLSPALPLPPLADDGAQRVGRGEVAGLVDEFMVVNRPRSVEVRRWYDGVERSGFMSSLVVSGLPRQSVYPDQPPVLYVPSLAGEDYSTFGFFRLVPSAEVKRKVRRKKADQVDEAKELGKVSAAGMEARASDAGLEDSLADLSMAESVIAEDESRPWLIGSFVVAVTAEGEDELVRRVNELRQVYDNNGVRVVVPMGSQASLLREMLPGAGHKVTDYDQTMTVEGVGVCGVNFGSSAGDPVRGALP
jgi:hypothetical protein